MYSKARSREFIAGTSCEQRVCNDVWTSGHERWKRSRPWTMVNLYVSSQAGTHPKLVPYYSGMNIEADSSGLAMTMTTTILSIIKYQMYQIMRCASTATYLLFRT